MIKVLHVPDRIFQKYKGTKKKISHHPEINTVKKKKA